MSKLNLSDRETIAICIVKKYPLAKIGEILNRSTWIKDLLSNETMKLLNGENQMVLADKNLQICWAVA